MGFLCVNKIKESTPLCCEFSNGALTFMPVTKTAYGIWFRFQKQWKRIGSLYNKPNGSSLGKATAKGGLKLR